MRTLSHGDVIAALTPAEAVEAIRQPLLDGFDPVTDPHRQKVPLPHGEMHLLPSALGGAVGVKVLGIQPAHSRIDVPLVQGTYLLMGGETLTPELAMDAGALTQLRTPAVSVAGVFDRLRASAEPLECVRDVSFTFVSRHEPAGLRWPWAASESAEAVAALGRAGLVVTATSSSQPILSAEHLRNDATVLAVGAHTADTRELHESVLDGAQVVVEDLGAAQREAGDVVIAVEKGALAWDDVVPMAAVVRGEVELDPARRVVFKTVGMPWEDLAVARAVTERA